MSEPTAVNARTQILDIIASWGIVGMVRESVADALEAKDQEIVDLTAKLEEAQARERALREALGAIRSLLVVRPHRFADQTEKIHAVLDAALAEPTP